MGNKTKSSKSAKERMRKAQEEAQEAVKRNKRKKFLKNLAKVGAVVCGIAALVIVSYYAKRNGSTDEPKAFEPAPTHYKWKAFSLNDENPDCSNADLCIVSKARADNYLGLRYIDGALANQTAKRISYIAISYGLYSGDTKVGSCFANANFIDAGGKWEFSALCTGGERDTVTYKIDDVTYW